MPTKYLFACLVIPITLLGCTNTNTNTTASSPSSSSTDSSLVSTSSTTDSVEASSDEPTTSIEPVPSVSEAPSVPTGTPEKVSLSFESQVADFSSAELEAAAIKILNDKRSWPQAGFSFVSDPNSKYKVILAEGAEVDKLCLPLNTYGTVSCQNGPIVALNADRWRIAVEHWDSSLQDYRTYLINHEVGHLLGQRHPKPRCPVPGAPAGVMEQQTGGLKGCVGNPWPRDWEIVHASSRPVVYAPLPAWGPKPVPANGEK